MSTDLLDLYRQASEWTSQKVAGTTDLDAATPCEQWRVRDVLNHVLETQRFFLSTGRGEEASPPGPNPPDTVTEDPAGDLAAVQSDIIATYSEPGVIDKTGPSLGIAFADQLIHGWDVAKASDQDATMPDGLAQAAYDLIHGKFTDEQRAGLFKPEVPVGDEASPQDRLLAYTGRNPG
jgi:uncharacterized protein (TIGR03086 family)